MTRAKLHPSPAITVAPEVPIRDCVALMNRHDVGSVLVVSEARGEGLVGIFTERDVLKNVELIRMGSYWDFPVSSVMSRNLVTIAAEELGEAAEVMGRHGFRHLPVVRRDPADGTAHLLGLVSMRDLVRALPAGPRTESLLPIYVCSTSPGFLSGMESVLVGARREGVSVRSGIPDGRERSLWVVDASSLSLQELAALLKRELDGDSSARVAVVYDPKEFPERPRELLERLQAGTGRVELFAKPLNLLQFGAFVAQL